MDLSGKEAGVAKSSQTFTRMTRPSDFPLLGKYTRIFYQVSKGLAVWKLSNKFQNKFVKALLPGGISHFILNWSKLTNYRETLQIVKGFTILFFKKLHQKVLVEKEIQDLLSKGTITKVQGLKDRFVRNIL